MDWYVVLLACLGLLILAVAWLPAYLRRLPLSLPIICVGFGYALFSAPGAGAGPDLLDHPHLTERLTELVVIVSLMGAGLRLNRDVGRRRWMTAWRLLAVTMPLTIVAVALLGWWALGLAPATAMLLGAVLAPTDPVLASEVQVGPPDEADEDEVRFGLTSESGLNDGLAFPFVNLAIAMAASGAAPGMWTLEWLAVDVAWKTAAGIAVGALAGQGLSWAIFRWIDEAGDSLVALGITFLAYGLAELAQGYGFLAVFVAALTLRRWERTHHYRAELHVFAEQVERMLMMVLLVVFGGAVAGGLLAPLTWPGALVGLALLLVLRPAAGLAGLAGSGRPLRERLAISFFGIRGVGSVYYLSHAFNQGKFEAEADALFALVGFIVLVSILLHGMTAAPVMRHLAAIRRRG
ncbi:MAG: sodium:proton antiporter [Alphaproteobacteria bacterium]|nr:sodium:proton antiporter [Alphaproteobacteria bacterium]